ncbi:unnamed protein product [Didymodactylos carnosus]|uniref:Uncharacterized protein n=1 Tax=Didymodactylos carnosus TaxID=1234261 RepID=A0A815SLI6_9BILA|nr:unnamed protein product [Didymodactylos carnosus]CAF4356864.1 unnamed protein product [Didymodactylos carnosus]
MALRTLDISFPDKTPESKFVDTVKELGIDTKDVVVHQAEEARNTIQQAFGQASEYLRERVPAEYKEKAAGVKDALIQTAIDIKDATVDVVNTLTSSSAGTSNEQSGKTTTSETTSATHIDVQKSDTKKDK